MRDAALRRRAGEHNLPAELPDYCSVVNPM
jgi:hypothetical protein